jgi:hypothetical protein
MAAAVTSGKPRYKGGAAVTSARPRYNREKREKRESCHQRESTVMIAMPRY